MGQWEPQALRNRHVAMMDLMISCPWLKVYEIASILECDKQTVTNVVNSELFQLAFKEYQKDHSKKVSDLAAKATVEAIEFHRGVVRGEVADANGNLKKVDDIQLRQASAKDILALGHGKAIDKSISMNATGSLEDALKLIEAQKKQVTSEARGQTGEVPSSEGVGGQP